MYWNHRVFEYCDENYPDEKYYGFSEVYYTDDDAVIGWIDPREFTLFAENLEDLKELLAWMRDACKKPVLNETKMLEERAAEVLYKRPCAEIVDVEDLV